MKDIMVVGVLRAALECGVSIPKELFIIGFDNREFSEYLSPRITMMDLPLHEMGYKAIDALLRVIRGEEINLSQSPLCTLIERDSVASFDARYAAAGGK